MRIEGECEGEIDVKRFYIPGVCLYDLCPKCEEEIEMDLGVMYLSYPIVGEEKTVHFYCEECDEEWDNTIILEMTIKSVE